MTVAVGIDVGTSGVKAIAVDEAGAVVARAEEAYRVSMPRPGWVEQEPDAWVRAAESALAQLGVTPSGTGLSGQMHGLVCLDRDDRVIRPAILWNDQRTGTECAEIESALGFERLVALTGNRALTGFTAPKLLWVRRHEPESYARTASVMLPKDYVRLRLTGEHATDAADASGTLLFDVERRRWSEEVVDALELPAGWLPRVLESPEISGRTAEGVPVAAGAGDQAAAALGVGIVAPGAVSIVLGTSGVVFAALPRFTVDAQARVHVFCHALPDAWHAMGVMLSAAGSLEWLREAVFAGAPFDALTEAAASWAPGAEGLLFAPYLQGERTPYADPDARGAFVGLSLRHDRGALVRAVLEGVAFGLRDSLELLRELGVAPTVARVSGGGARSRLWLEILAAVLDLPLELTAAEEGSAYGAALLGGVASGMWSSPVEAVDATVSVRATVEPRPDWVETYEAVYARYRGLYPALRDLSETVDEEVRV
jgi:xylulokinase